MSQTAAHLVEHVMPRVQVRQRVLSLPIPLRLQLNAAGQVELKLKIAWPDGTPHRVMSPLEFMQRLAALVPRPSLHLIR